TRSIAITYLCIKFLSSEDLKTSETSKNKEMEESSDDKFESENVSEENFNNYLQEWSDILEEERQQFEKDTEGEYANNDKFAINNTYSAIDVNAKWKLFTLFKQL
ncbi:18613_t:CDS:1, partial [Racocetra fulgida]